MPVVSIGGELGPDDIGICLMHEHVLINEMREDRSAGLLNDPALMCNELSHFRDAGGRTIVELSVGELSLAADPDPARHFNVERAAHCGDEHTRSSSQIENLARLSRITGLNIVLGTGLYRDPYIDHHWIDRVGVNGVTELLTRDIEVGFGDTGIRAGIIGEVGSDSYYVSCYEERALRGAAKAQRRTGLAISTHAARWPVGLDQLDILVDEGVDPRRVIIGHCDTVKIPEYHEQLARRGCFVQFDTIRGGSEYELESRVKMIRSLIDRGFSKHILLSHDICMRPHLKEFGGTGYDFIINEFLHRLTGDGLADELKHELLVDNPMRALTGDN